MATPTPTDGGQYLIPTRVDIHHRTPDGTRHGGRVEYCHTCTPEPNPRDYVVPAARRGDYRPPIMTTDLTSREVLTALADAGPHHAPTGDPLTHPARGTRVLFQVGRRTWHAGVVETTTVGAGAPRVAYVHPADLARARADRRPTDVRRARPVRLYAYPTTTEE